VGNKLLQLGGQQRSVPNWVVYGSLNLNLQVQVNIPVLGDSIKTSAKQTHLSPVSPALRNRPVKDGL
jgi:hypothetical protein